MQNVLAVVDLRRLRRNAALIKSYAKRPLIAVVKDDAYGHGAIRIAHALSDMVWAFAVATVDEGMELRTAGIQNDILVLTPPTTHSEVIRMLFHDLTATLSSTRFFHLLRGLEGVRAHIAVNTGMNRYGVRPSQLSQLLNAACLHKVRIEGVYSHLFAPSETDALAGQSAIFVSACERVKRYFPHAVCHLSATGGMLKGACFDAVRAGISLYGYLPEGFENSLSVRPVMKLYATAVESRRRVGSGAGYNFAPENATHFHTLRVGYGDGFFREGGLGSVGNLCMDACVREGKAKAGRRVLILKDAAAYAKEHRTTAYEVLVRIGARAEKKYIT